MGKNKFKNIYFNGIALSKHTTGLGVYSRNVFSVINSSQKIKKIFNLHHRDETHIKLPSFLSFQNGTLGHLARILWYQVMPLTTWMRKNDLFYSPLPEGSLFGRFKQVITIHDLIPVLFPEHHGKLKYYYKYFVPLLIKRSQIIISPSESTKTDIINYYNVSNEKVIVVPNGYDPLTFYIDKSHSRKNFQNFIFIGDLRPTKNFSNVLEALSFLGNKNIKLTVVGKQDDRYYPFYKNIIEKLSLEEQVVFTGIIKNSELRELYHQSIGLLYPSLYEGFGLPILEALACGCPVITSNNSSMKEVCPSLTMKVNPKKPEEISNSMRTLINDNSYKESIIRDHSKYVSTNTWDKNFDHILLKIKERINAV